jgi:predicted phage terminase large subunit-like protein
MQRLHENDLIGHILENKETKYEHLILPAEYDGVRFHSSIGFVDPRTTEGELLWPEKFSRKDIDSLKATLGGGYIGQYQQRPAPLGGFIFKKDWFLNRIKPSRIIGTYISFDTALSDLSTAAYTACVVGQLLPDYRMVIREVYKDRLAFPQQVKLVEDMANKYKDQELRGVVIESKATGLSIIQTMKQSSPEWIYNLLSPYNPTVDKSARGQLASVWCSNGSVILPPPSEDSTWLLDFETDLFSFPNGKYKDTVDAFNQLILWTDNLLADGLRARMN